MTAIDLPNGTVIYHLNETPLIDGDFNSPLYISKTYDFGMHTHDTTNRHDG